MDDSSFLGLAEAAIGYVDERYGRAAAWFTALFVIALPILLAIGALVWLTR